MMNALTAALLVFSTGFILSTLYSFYDAKSFPWFKEVHVRLQFWQQFACCMTFTLIFTLVAFLVFLGYAYGVFEVL